ncbi:hypothetical protein D3C85_167100 [compost metagenome]
MYNDKHVSTIVRINRALVRQRKADKIMSMQGKSFAFRLAALNAMSIENRTM